MSLGKEIKKVRLSKQMNQDEFAKSVNITPAWLNKLENEKKGVTDTVVAAIFNVYGVDIKKTASEWKPPADELLALRVTVKVLSQELAKVQSKLYNRPLEDCLNELEQNTILTLRSEMKGGGGV